MKLLFKIAWRNIFRHKGKSFVIGIILFLGALLMTIGNAVISGMDLGLSNNIVNLFTGDLVIKSGNQEDDNVLFDVEGKPLEVISDYKKVNSVLEKNKNIDKFLPANAGYVIIFNENGNIGDGVLLGVDIKKYKDMFKNSYKVVEGKDMNENERGVLYSSNARDRTYNFMNIWVVPKGFGINKNNLSEDAKENIKNIKTKDELVYMGVSDKTSTVDVKVDVKGVIKYRALSSIWGVYSIVDSASFRECFNYINKEENLDIDKDNKNLIENSENLDNIFGDDTIIKENEENNKIISYEDLKKETTRMEKNINYNNNIYNMVFIKLKKGTDINKESKKLQNELIAEGSDAKVITWQKAVGPIGGLTKIIRAALFFFTMLIFFVAIIIIMNTITMAALERSAEIAMMRAIGAGKSFISKMFFVETSILAFFFGGIGMASGICVVIILSNLGITSDNDFLQILFGGDRFMPIVTISDIFIGIFELTIVTITAVIYPISIVRKIVPLDAIARE